MNRLRDGRSLLFAEPSRIFASLAYRSIDEANITERAPVMADFIHAAMVGHSLARSPIATGFSNGAIMLAASLLTCPRLLARAIQV